MHNSHDKSLVLRKWYVLLFKVIRSHGAATKGSKCNEKVICHHLQHPSMECVCGCEAQLWFHS